MQDGKGTLLIMLSPESMRGSTHLMIEREDGPVVMWTYSPATQRVRKIFAADAEDDFLGTELRLADLGLLSRRGEYIFLGEEEYLGKQTYKLSFVPYTPVSDSRIFTWVDAESLLPFQREYYDGDDKLRKVERFEKITHLNGIPTPVLIQREDAQEGTSTECRVTAVRYDVNVPDEPFDPKKLVQAANSPFWQEHMAQADASK